MDKKQFCFLFSVLIGIIVPILFIMLLGKPQIQKAPDDTKLSTMESHQQVLVPVLLDDGKVVQMQLDDYLTGVLLAEMPAQFHAEALRAQAVVARTYTLKRMNAGYKHETAAVCTSSACCQAYCSIEKYAGDKSLTEKVSTAVHDTSGEVLLYQGKYIEATYFSCSGGRTEDAVAVWGTDVPYLQAVDSPGEEKATHYSDQVTMTADAFLKKLGLLDKSVNIGEITYTDGDGVESIKINEKRFTGIEVRSKLNLRSTTFKIRCEDNQVIITTMGYGHRVGMSQYGAQAMAESGSTYDEILLYYYSGAQLGHMYGN